MPVPLVLVPQHVLDAFFHHPPLNLLLGGGRLLQLRWQPFVDWLREYNRDILHKASLMNDYVSNSSSISARHAAAGRTPECIDDSRFHGFASMISM